MWAGHCPEPFSQLGGPAVRLLPGPAAGPVPLTKNSSELCVPGLWWLVSCLPRKRLLPAVIRSWPCRWMECHELLYVAVRFDLASPLEFAPDNDPKSCALFFYCSLGLTEAGYCLTHAKQRIDFALSKITGLCHTFLCHCRQLASSLNVRPCCRRNRCRLFARFKLCRQQLRLGQHPVHSLDTALQLGQITHYFSASSHSLVPRVQSSSMAGRPSRHGLGARLLPGRVNLNCRIPAIAPHADIQRPACSWSVIHIAFLSRVIAMVIRRTAAHLR